VLCLPDPDLMYKAVLEHARQLALGVEPDDFEIVKKVRQEVGRELAEQLDLVTKLDTLYHAQLSMLCRRLGVSDDGVFTVKYHRQRWWKFSGDDRAFYIHDVITEPQTVHGYEPDVNFAFFGKEFVSFVCENTLHVLDTACREPSR